MRRSQQFLTPNFDAGGLYRTRSQGHGPAPVVNVFNEQVASASNSSRSPPYPRSPELRGRNNRLGDDLAEEFVDLAIENRRLRSRSRGRSDVSFDRRDQMELLDVRQRERDLWDMEKKQQWEQEFEIRQLKAEAKRNAEEDERKRVIAEYEQKQREEKEERKRIITEHELRQREEEEKRKEEEKKIRDKIEREKREAKEKEEREWDEFLRKQREKEEKEKAEKAKKEEEIDEEMRKRLMRLGYTNRQIELMISEEKVKRTTKITSTTTSTSTNALDLWRPVQTPVYAKVHRDYLSIDTLNYYDVPYEYDRYDSNYIIILREMDKYETEVLFEHTRRLRAGKLLLEPAKDKPQYAWYRKRDRSTSQVRKMGILEFKR